MIEYAKHYLSAGLSVLPAKRAEKRPAVGSWKSYQTRRPTPAEVNAWFANAHDGLCIVAGAVSGNLEMIDFDFAGELFEPWKDKVNAAMPDLLSQLVIETTQSGGRHAVYRCQIPMDGSMKLAQRRITVQPEDIYLDGGKEYVRLCGKAYAVKTDKTGKHVIGTLIETRGEAGLFLCAPTAGYEIVQGSLSTLPTLTTKQRDVLLMAAWELNEYQSTAETMLTTPATTDPKGTLRPGDDYDQRGDVRALLQSHGWQYACRNAINELWRRPGKNICWSASLRISDRRFFVFSSNGHPFDPDKDYRPFAVYAMLEHNGDFSAAAAELAKQGYGENADPTCASDVDLSALLPASAPIDDDDDDEPISLTELIANFQGLNTPIIHGLLREGETMNIIASPKVGKSWMVDLLAISLASGLEWLGYKVDTGRVLLVDNELHINTTTYRMMQVAKALGVDTPLFSDHIKVKSLRGKLKDLHRLAKTFMKIKPGEYKVIVIDAFYRTLPLGVDENDNGAIANLYNLLDLHAARLKCAFVLIHHASKGNQSNKSVTDVGAGAGSQSRAVDTHLVIRPHQDTDTFVVDAAVRSWAPIKSFVIRKQHPLFVVDPKADPEALLGVEKKRESKSKLTLEAFVETCVGAHDPCSARLIGYYAEQQHDLSEYKAKTLLEMATEQELVVRIKAGSKMLYVKNRDGFGGDKGQWVAALLANKPALNAAEIARITDTTERYVRRLKGEIDSSQNPNCDANSYGTASYQKRNSVGSSSVGNDHLSPLPETS